MSNETSILITILYGQQLLRVAIRASNEILTNDVVMFYSEPENKKVLEGLLPEHCKGKIMEVQEIFEVIIK